MWRRHRGARRSRPTLRHRSDADDRPLAGQVAFAAEPLAAVELVPSVFVASEFAASGLFAAGGPDGCLRNSVRIFFLRAMRSL